MNEEFFKKQREYCTQQYLLQAKEKGYDENHSNTLMNLFWEKVDYYPTYALECSQARDKAKRNGTSSYFVDTSKNPDLDYAGRMSGISDDYIWQLMGYFSRVIWKG
jgi:hypothetical protein